MQRVHREACLVGVMLAACARGPTTSEPRPAGAPPPSSDRVIAAPTPDTSELSPAELTHLLRGLHLLAGGRAEAAIPHLRLALLYDPASPFLHERLGMAWGAAGREDRATALVELGLSKTPNDPDLNLVAGRLATAHRDFEKAIRHLRLAAASLHTLQVAGPHLIDALCWQGGRVQAEIESRALLQRAPANLELALGLAGILEDHGRLTASLELYGLARLQHPQERDAALGEARVLELLGKPRAAADALVSLFRYYPDAPDLYVEITRLLRRANDPDAEAYRAEALRQSEGDPNARALVAAGDLLEGHAEQGIELLRRTVERFPNDLQARLYLAELYQQRGHVPACLELLAGPELARSRAPCQAAAGRVQEVIDGLAQAGSADARSALTELVRLLSPHLPRTQTEEAYEILRKRLAPVDEVTDDLVRGQIADAYDQGLAAIEAVSRAVRSEPNNAQHALLLADLEVRYGKAATGIERMQALLVEDTFDLYRLNALGFTLVDLNTRLDEAEVYLRRAYRIAPEEGFILDSMGWLFFRRGAFEHAVQFLERATHAAANSAEILRHLGDAYRALGRASEAREAYRAALAAFPTAWLRRLLEERLAEYGGGSGASPS